MANINVLTPSWCAAIDPVARDENVAPNEITPPLLHTRAFWLVQIAAWLTFAVVVFVPALALSVFEGTRTPAVIIRVACNTALGFVLSSTMATAYVRIPPKRLEGAAAVRIALTASSLGAILWALAEISVLHAIGTHPVTEPSLKYILVLARAFLFLGLWSTVFLVLLLSHRVRVTAAEATRLAARAAKAQIQMLRAQLNPHFLFNTLNSVVTLIGQNPAKAQSMVRDLSELLRAALADIDAPNHTVADDLEFVRLYLNCERIRFEDRLKVSVDVPASLHHLPLPSMTLQPLVENAIKHGRRDHPFVELRIEGRETPNGAELAVRNRGHLGTPTMPGTGTGLENARTRLRIRFPESGKIHLTEEDGWVMARVSFDVRHESRDSR